jgi:hypothetical protein
VAASKSRLLYSMLLAARSILRRCQSCIPHRAAIELINSSPERVNFDMTDFYTS